MPKTSARRERCKEQIEAEIGKLRKQLSKLEDAERIETNRALPGSCFRYRNCYSCPKDDSDYWFAYKMVTGLDEFGNPEGVMFQIDKDGKIEIERFRWGTLGGWTQIATTELRDAFEALRKKVMGFGIELVELPAPSPRTVRRVGKK